MRKKLFATVLCLCMAVQFLSAQVPALEPKLAVSDPYAASVYYRQLAAVELTGDYRTDIVNIALSQVGYHEGFVKADYGGNTVGWGNYTEYSSVYGGANAQWCAMFVSWCARQAGIPFRVLNTAARAAIGKADSASARYMFHIQSKRPAVYTPFSGDLVFLSKDGKYANHVGIVVKTDENGIWTVEGNALNAVRVMFYPYDSKYIVYYGVYTEQSDSASADFSVTELQFINSDGTFSLLPDSSTERYDFEKLWAVHGQLWTPPTRPFEKEGAVLQGYRVQRAEDDAWYCTDGCWRSAEELQRSGSSLYCMSPGGSKTVNGFFTEAKVLRLYCVWTVAGKTVEDSAAIQDTTDLPLSALPTDAWYYESVRQAVSLGWLKQGVSFHPQDAATRADFVCLLYRMQSSPKITEAAPFTDISQGTELADAAAWAYTAGIVQGATDSTLNPNGRLTREQAVTMLYRLFCGTAENTLPEYPDSDQVSSWAVDAMAWSISQKLVQGVPSGDGTLLLRPRQDLQCAEAVALLTRIERN